MTNNAGKSALDVQLQELFEGCKSLTVRQEEGWSEMLMGEMRNKYQILKRDGSKWGFAAEREGGAIGHIKRQSLRKYRSLDIVVSDPQRREILRFARPACLYFSTMQVFLGERHLLGIIKRRLSLINRVYSVYCTTRGSLLGKIKSPLWRPWTFPLIDDRGQTIGRVAKQWGGFLREGLTDADTFSVQFPSAWRASEKALLLATALTIDLDFFER